MDKVLYVASGLARLAGVRKKVYAQCSGFESAGFSVVLVSLDLYEGEDDPFENVGRLGFRGGFRSFLFNKGQGPLKTLGMRYKMVKAVSLSVKKESPDVVYLRYPTADPFWVFFLLFCSVPVVVEHQTKELDEFGLRGKWSLGYLSELLFGRVFRLLVSGIVAVTEEIKRYELSKAWPKDIKAITVGNGFDVESVELRTPPELMETLHVLFVANISIWHGLDRIIKGMNQAKNVKMVLHVVGDGEILSDLRDLAEPSKDRIIFHGPLFGTELDKLFDECHIAIGSLGIHRINLMESSVLKLREYCSRGIPFAVSAIDPDFPSDYPYVLKLPSGESPIDVNLIISFAKETMDDRTHHVKMRNYAIEKLTWKRKAKRISRFLSLLIN